MDKNSKILDIGTGLGAMSILLAINGFKVITGQPKEDPEWEEHVEHYEDYEELQHGFGEFDWKENAKAMGGEDKIEFRYLNAEKLPFMAK